MKIAFSAQYQGKVLNMPEITRNSAGYNISGMRLKKGSTVL